MATAPGNADAAPSAASGCADEDQDDANGDPAVLGFPISYRTTFIEADNKEGKPMVVSMEVTEFQVASLDAAHVRDSAGHDRGDESAGIVESGEQRQRGEARVGCRPSWHPTGSPARLRVGVPEVANKTTRRPLIHARCGSRLIAELEKQKIEAIPMAAASPADLQTRATELGVDYLLMAEITELKASKPGGLTRMMKRHRVKAPQGHHRGEDERAARPAGRQSLDCPRRRTARMGAWASRPGWASRSSRGRCISRWRSAGCTGARWVPSTRCA